MGTSMIGRGQRWLLPGTVAFLLMAGVVATLVAPDTAEEVGFVGMMIGVTAAALLFTRRSVGLSSLERRAWRSIGVGLWLFLAGVLGFAVFSMLGLAVPAFGVLDIFFLGGYAFVILALYRLIRVDRAGREWMLTLIDALIGGIAIATLVWSFVFDDLIDAMAEAPWWETAIAVTYPIGDVVIIVGLLILVIRRSNYHMDPRLVLLALGVGAQVYADFLYLRGIGQDFATAQPVWSMNLTALTFLVLTGAMVDRVPRKREFPDEPTPAWALMWPYALAASLLVAHIQNYRALGPGFNEFLLLDALIFIGVIIFLRQVYVIYRDRNQVDRKRAELVASVSHELRTPLTAMVGFLTLLDDHAEEFPVDARQDMVAEAADQARHMSRLVSDLLVLAKGETTRFSLEAAEERAMAIIVAVLRSVDLAETRLEEDLDAEVVVRVDADRIKQALNNLLSNAVRYGGDRCLIVARVDGADLVLEVHDNGPGVPTRYESAIWQQFERGAHRFDATEPGLGIGLNIVQAVAESHGGWADYRRSERLGGACFRLTIPGCVVDEPTRTRVEATPF